MSEEESTVVTLKVRVTPEFREKLVTTAKENNRSMNAEIVDRLEKSFLDIPNIPASFHTLTSTLDNAAKVIENQEKTIAEQKKTIESLTKSFDDLASVSKEILEKISHR